MRVNGKIALRNTNIYGLIIDGALYQNENYQKKDSKHPADLPQMTME